MSQPSTYSVTIEGFKTKEEVEAFISWYSGSGEQELVDWMYSMHRDLPDKIRQPINGCYYLNSYHPFKWNDNTCCVSIGGNSE
jgi:hypothetical protein